MASRIITFNGESNLLAAIKIHLMENNPIIIATDTQWGICATEPSIINKMKKRANKEVILLVDSQYKHVFDKTTNDPSSNIRSKFIEKFWPGQVTVIYDNISYRRTNADMLNTIIDYCKIPIYCSSANITNHNPVNNIVEAMDTFNLSEFDVLLIVTPSQTLIPNSLPSTIIDLNEFKIIREGINAKEVIEFIKSHKIESH